MSPLPSPIKIESEWITLRELVVGKAFIVGLDTNTRLPNQALYDWT